jgi:hypothetical protein
MKEMLVVALIAAVVLIISIRKWIKSRALKIASENAKVLFPVWAIQGPFKSGEQSGNALLYAHMAISGPELPEKTLEAARLHSAAYDDDPETWEENRNDALAFVTEETMESLKAVHAFAAADQIAMGNSIDEEQLASITEYIVPPLK